MKRGCDSRSFLALRVVALLIVTIFLILSTGIVSAADVSSNKIRVAVSGVTDGTMTGCSAFNYERISNIASNGGTDCAYDGDIIYDGTEWALPWSTNWNDGGFLSWLTNSYISSEHYGGSILFEKDTPSPFTDSSSSDSGWKALKGFEKSGFTFTNYPLFTGWLGSGVSDPNGCNFDNAKVVVTPISITESVCPVNTCPTCIGLYKRGDSTIDFVAGSMAMTRGMGWPNPLGMVFGPENWRMEKVYVDDPDSVANPYTGGYDETLILDEDGRYYYENWVKLPEERVVHWTPEPALESLRSDYCDIFLDRTYSYLAIGKDSDGTCKIILEGERKGTGCPGGSAPLAILKYDSSKGPGEQFSGGVFYEGMASAYSVLTRFCNPVSATLGMNFAKASSSSSTTSYVFSDLTPLGAISYDSLTKMITTDRSKLNLNEIRGNPNSKFCPDWKASFIVNENIDLDSLCNTAGSSYSNSNPQSIYYNSPVPQCPASAGSINAASASPVDCAITDSINKMLTDRYTLALPFTTPSPETCNGIDDDGNGAIDDYKGLTDQVSRDKLCLSMAVKDSKAVYTCDSTVLKRCVLAECTTNADCIKTNRFTLKYQTCDTTTTSSTYHKCVDRTYCSQSANSGLSGVGSNKGDNCTSPSIGCSEPKPTCSGTPATGCECTGTTRCVPDCAGKNCGDDGCGGTCGTCSSPKVCQNAQGKCVCNSGQNGATCTTSFPPSSTKTDSCTSIGQICNDQCKCEECTEDSDCAKYKNVAGKQSKVCERFDTASPNYHMCIPRKDCSSTMGDECTADTDCKDLKKPTCSKDPAVNGCVCVGKCTGTITSQANCLSGQTFWDGNAPSCSCICIKGQNNAACSQASPCPDDRVCNTNCQCEPKSTSSAKCGDGTLNAYEECEFNINNLGSIMQNADGTSQERGFDKTIRNAFPVSQGLGDSIPGGQTLYCKDINANKPTCNSNCKCVGSSTSSGKCGNGVRDGNEGCEFNVDAKGEIVIGVDKKPVEISITIPPETSPKNCSQRNSNKSICSPPGSKYSGGECQCMPEIKFEEGCTDANSKVTSGDERHCLTQPAPENKVDNKDSTIVPADCDDPEKNNFDSTMGPVIAPSGGACCSLSTSMDKTKSLNVAVNAYLVIGGKLKLIDTSKPDSTVGGNIGPPGHVLTAHGDGTYGGIDSEIMFGSLSTKNWDKGRRWRGLGSIDAYIKYTDGDAASMTCGDTIVSVLIHGFLDRPTRYCSTIVKGKHIQKGDVVVFGQIDTNGDVKTECLIKEGLNYRAEGVEGFNKYGPVSLTVLEDSSGECTLKNLRWEVDGARKDGPFSVSIDKEKISKVEIVADVKDCEGKNIALKIWEIMGLWGGAGNKPIISFDRVNPSDGKIRMSWVPPKPLSVSSGNRYRFELIVEGKSYYPMRTSLLSVDQPSNSPGSKIRVPISPPVAESVKDNPNANAGTALPVLSKPFTITDGKNEYTCDPLGGIQKFLSENAAAAGSALKILGSALSLDSFVCSSKVKASGSLGKDLDSLAFIPSDVIVYKLDNPFEISVLNAGDKMVLVDESSTPSVGDKILNEIKYLEFKLPDGYKFKSIDKDDDAVIVQGSGAISNNVNVKTITATSKPLEDVSPKDVVNAEKVEPSCDILKLPMTMSVTIAGKYNDESISETVTLKRLKTPRNWKGDVIVNKNSQFYGYAPVYIGTNKLSGKNSGMKMEVELRYLPSKDNIFEYGSGSTGSKPSTIVSVSFAKDTNPFSLKSSEPTNKYQLETAGIGGGYYIPGTSYTIVSDAATNVAVAFKLATSVCMAACVKQSGKTNYNHYPGLLFLDADRSSYTFDTIKDYLGREGRIVKYRRFDTIPKNYAYSSDPVEICDVETGLGWSSGGERVTKGETDAYNYMNDIYTKNALNKSYTQSFLWMDGTDSTKGKIGSFYMSELPPTVPCFLNILSGDKPFGLTIFDATKDPKEILADMPKYRLDIGGHWGIRSPVIIGAIELYNNNVRHPDMTDEGCVNLKELMNKYFTSVASKVKRSTTPWNLQADDLKNLNAVLKEVDSNHNYNIVSSKPSL